MICKMPAQITRSMFVIFFYSLTGVVLSSNFRGGTMQIMPTLRPGMMQVMYRLSWQQGNPEGYFCNESTIASRIFFIEGTLKSSGKCGGVRISTLPLQCTEYSSVDDWMSGVFCATFLCDKSRIQIWYEGNGWPVLNNGQGGVSLHLNSSMVIRKDTGRVNSSPIAMMEPIIRILKNCSQIITIPVADSDNDLIRCRWSKREPDNECGNVCTKINGLSLNEDRCQLHFERNSATPGKYAVTLQIEDYALTLSDFPMSSIPLQFMIDIVDHGVSCMLVPTISDSISGRVVHIAVGTVFNDAIVANSEDLDDPIKAIYVLGPEGMNKSELKQYNNSTRGLFWSIDVSWRPTSEQTGLHLFCFTAITALKVTSTQECKELLVKESSDGKDVESGDEADSENKFMNSEMRAAIASLVINVFGVVILSVVYFCRRICKRNEQENESNQLSRGQYFFNIVFNLRSSRRRSNAFEEERNEEEGISNGVFTN